VVGFTRKHQYYQPKQPVRDWHTKQLIETALREHPSYGHKRLARHLGINKKRVLRVMKLFGIKPYRRVTPKPYKRPKDSVFPNLLLTESPQCKGDIIHHHPPPRIIHSDQGSEYTSADYAALVHSRATLMSMSHPGCPWENGYQESFYGKLKVEFGDPKRYETLGELVAVLHEAIHYYNTKRIHAALGTSPRQFAEKQER
jgi:transposase InsO family protein